MSATPAQLGFLAIYNPSLGTTDDTIGDQIIYYASQQSLVKKRRHRRRGGLADAATPEERNERQRQIGLAQGMVEFGRSFAGDQPVDFVETERSRVIVHELEPGWWILAVSAGLGVLLLGSCQSLSAIFTEADANTHSLFN